MQMPKSKQYIDTDEDECSNKSAVESEPEPETSSRKRPKRKDAGKAKLAKVSVKAKTSVSSDNEEDLTEKGKTKSEKSKTFAEFKQKKQVDNDVERFDLGNNRFVSVSEFKGSKYVDIREYYLDKETSELKPSRKGIALRPEEWSTLTKQFVESIDQRLPKKN